MAPTPNAFARSFRVVERHRDQRERGGRQQSRENTPAARGRRTAQRCSSLRRPAQRRQRSPPARSGTPSLRPMKSAMRPRAEGTLRRPTYAVTPLHVLRAIPEIGLRTGNGQVHNRRVEHDHQLRDRDHEQGPEAVRWVGYGYWGSRGFSQFPSDMGAPVVIQSATSPVNQCAMRITSHEPKAVA